MLAGCGNPYRPVVASISPTGPASQPTKWAVTLSNTGVLSVIDFSGDTVMSTAQTTPDPSYLAMGLSGDAYMLHCQKPTIANPNPPCSSLIDGINVSDKMRTKDLVKTSLVAGAQPSQLSAAANYIYVTQPGLSSVAILQTTSNTGQAASALTEIPVAASPNYVVLRNQTPYVYALSGAAAGPTGTVTPIQVSTTTAITPISVGQHPVYGVLTADYRRAFVMNQGSNTVSVINTQTNLLDNSTALPTGTISVGSNPVWADIADSINELVVLNQGNGTTPGSLSIINIPLCNIITDPTSTCDAANPSDAANFGTVLRTIPVGINPFMVSVLQDQQGKKKAYISNTGSDSISVIDLDTMTKIKDIPVNGHPTWIAATSGNPTGKVYVICNNSDQLSIIYTDTDTLQTATLPIQGTGVSLRMNVQD